MRRRAFEVRRRLFAIRRPLFAMRTASIRDPGRGIRDPEVKCSRSGGEVFAIRRGSARDLKGKCSRSEGKHSRSGEKHSRSGGELLAIRRGSIRDPAGTTRDPAGTTRDPDRKYSQSDEGGCDSRRGLFEIAWTTAALRTTTARDPQDDCFATRLMSLHDRNGRDSRMGTRGVTLEEFCASGANACG